MAYYISYIKISCFARRLCVFYFVFLFMYKFYYFIPLFNFSIIYLFFFANYYFLFTPIFHIIFQLIQFFIEVEFVFPFSILFNFVSIVYNINCLYSREFPEIINRLGRKKFFSKKIFGRKNVPKVVLGVKIEPNKNFG